MHSHLSAHSCRVRECDRENFYNILWHGLNCLLKYRSETYDHMFLQSRQ